MSELMKKKNIHTKKMEGLSKMVGGEIAIFTLKSCVLHFLMTLINRGVAPQNISLSFSTAEALVADNRKRKR